MAWLEPSGKYGVVTIPNMDFVPEPVWGIITMTTREDGLFGVHNPIYWPQIFVSQRSMSYFAAIPRGPSVARDNIMFTQMTGNDFTVLQSVLEMPLGVVSDAFRREMTDAMEFLVPPQVQAARARRDLDTKDLFWPWTMAYIACNLITHPTTFRDAVRSVQHHQRLCRFIRGWLVWSTELPCRQEVRRDLMGAFSTDISVVMELAIRGCPVWHFRLTHTFTEGSSVRRWQPW